MTHHRPPQPDPASVVPSGRLSGWGRHPWHHSQWLEPAPDQLAAAVQQMQGITRGAGRSYGDSALASQVLSLAGQPARLHLDEHSGRLHCSAGISLAQALSYCLPRGWTLPVLPGTAAVTVGGAIASDVHGKNHHRDGCFSAWVKQLSLMLADGSSIRCSPILHSELFLATCGGMGLTGVITAATLQLRPLCSQRMHQRSLRSNNLEQTLALLREHAGSHYSVAWLDCLARGQQMGRGIVLLGEHSTVPDGSLQQTVPQATRLVVPFPTPGWLLNRYSMRAFNAGYYHLAARQPAQHVDFSSFFFPLDAIAHWNRLYGRRGFVQYQFVLPEASSTRGMTQILKTISASGRGAFLSVLKRFGPANQNLLSFPLQGYTLALDFRVTPSLFPLLERLDAMVLEHGGRIYLSKDARMSRDTFRRSYPKWERFVALRAQLGAQQRFNSLQSQRLGL